MPFNITGTLVCVSHIFFLFCYLQANSKNIKGNLKGDGMLNGGMLIVTAGGEKVLLSFKQSSPGDHVSNEKILEVLGIKVEEEMKEESGSAPEGGAAEGGTEK